MIGTNRRILSFILVSFLFVGIFMPCLVRVGMQYIVLMAEVIFILLTVIRHGSIPVNYNAVSILIPFIPFFLYYSFVSFYRIVIKGEAAALFFPEYRQALLIAVFVMMTVAALNALRHSGWLSSENFFRLLIAVGLIQLCCVLAAFLVPGVKSFFNGLTIRNSHNDRIIQVLNQPWMTSWRAFGLAENIYDGFGYVISIIITISFTIAVKDRSKKLILLSMAMLFMPLVNARTGIVLCMISVVIILLAYFRPLSVGYYVIGVLVVIAGVIAVFDKLPDSLQTALRNGVTQTAALFSGGGKVGIYSQILGEDMVFPQNILWGAGASPERLYGYTGIDSGYVQCLWRFGLIGSTLLLGGFFVCFYLAFVESRRKEYRVLVICCTVIFCIYCIKLYSLSSYANNFLVFSVLTMIVADESDPEGSRKETRYGV